MLSNAQYINQTSGRVEYYTPVEIIEAARRAMGSIDLDPASSAGANEVVRADNYLTEPDNGLAHDWVGNIWLNHPFSREGNPKWIGKLLREYIDGHVTQACCITFAATSEKWFRPLFGFPLCFLSPRTNYRLPDGSILRGVTKGSVVAYLGVNCCGFIGEFRQLGGVMLPARQKDWGADHAE